MRFAAIKTSPPQRTQSARDILRKLLETKPGLTDEQQPMVRAEELPVDLDQRVRLVGEW